MRTGECPSCGEITIDYDQSRGETICTNCGTVLQENAIVAEVGFTETSSGAAAVTGSFVGQNATSTRIVGPHGRTSGVESSELTFQRSAALLRNYQLALNLSDSIISSGERHLRMAYAQSFTKGRHIEHVIAVCLYMACRIANTNHMLIDFADFLRVNVFALGSTYLKLMKVLAMPQPKLVDPSIFIGRFVALLEFGEDSRQVAQDATRIAARFKEDWIQEGRRTAGICGAAIYIAAQMNNYRRSVQEIVQVVKISDTTIVKRLEEFSATASARLTVGDFKVTEQPTEAADPPSFTRAREKEREDVEGPGAGRVGSRGRRSRKRSRSEMEEQEMTSEPVYYVSTSTQESTTGNVPSASFENGLSGTQRKRQASPRKAQAELSQTNGTEMEIDIPFPLIENNNTSIQSPLKSSQDMLSSGPDMAIGGSQIQDSVEELEVDPKSVEEVQNFLESETGQMALSVVHTNKEAQPSEIQGQEEGDDGLLGLDEEELDAYICDENEAQLKERVWTEFNLDYLRKLAAKRYQDQTGEDLSRPKKKRKHKKKAPFTPGKTAFESVQAMMQASKKFSKRINYNALKAALPDVNENEKEDEDYKEDEEVNAIDEVDEDEKDDEKDDDIDEMEKEYRSLRGGHNEEDTGEYYEQEVW